MFGNGKRKNAMTGIAAVVFLRFDPTSGRLALASEKHYYYLNPNNYALDDLAVVHNGKEFGLARVIKHLSTKDEVAAGKVTKPLLGTAFFIDPEKYLAALSEITLQQEAAMTKRIEANIEAELNPGVRRGPNYEKEGW